MKKSILFFVFCFTLFNSFGQTPAAIQWQSCLGGTNSENGQDIQQTIDGGYIAIGSTNSNDGNVTGHHGGSDVWVVKQDASGVLEWQKCLGGIGDDGGSSIQQTIDGGYVLLGSTGSNDGDVSGNHGGFRDVWVVKLDASGVLEWQKCLGGMGDDFGSSIQQTIDGGYVLLGSTGSNDGDVSGNHGGFYDVWVVKLDATGVLDWQKCLGGTDGELGYSIQQTTLGECILVGYTYSNNGDVFGYHGNGDVWVVKLDASGILQWQKCLGGTDVERGFSIQKTIDGGSILAGYTSSYDGDVSGYHGGYDTWVVKLDATGALEWQKCLGGMGDEFGNSIKQTVDAGYILVGKTSSYDGDVSGNHGQDDAWVVKLDSYGVIQGQKCIGGLWHENGNSIQPTFDGGYILLGNASFNNGDVSGNHGQDDAWVVKLIECNATTNTSSTLTIASCSDYTAPSGQVLTTSGTFVDVIPNYLGCDSTITINFTKYSSETNTIEVNTCSLPYIWNGQTYNSYGTYTQVFQTIHGCDSTVNLTLNYLLISNQNICIVGVNPATGKNKVLWEKEQTQVIEQYKIYRENTQSGSFDLIGTTNYTDSSVFEDLLSNTNQQAYRYQIKYVDTCGNESSAGNIHKTIHLTINQGVGPTWNLIWTPYDGVSYSSYNIYRGSSASNMSLLTTVPSNLTSYTDANAPIGNVYYQIEIVGPNCNPSKSSYNTSRSNISTNDSSLDLAKIENTKFSIYPNPANNFIHIDYDGNIEKLEIIDAKGTVVFVSKENKKEYALPTHLQTGYYLVKIYSENQIPSRKELFIQR